MEAGIRANTGVGSREPSRRSTVLLLAASILGVLHLLDHVLRADHSGWPFIAEPTPFTFFAVAFLPVVLFAHLDRSHPRLRAGVVGFLLAGLVFAHVFLETPGDQYGVWAHNASTESHSLGQPNLLGIESPMLGVLAAGGAMLLNLVLLAAVVSLVVDAWNARTGRARAARVV